jgi:hypothetical protein
MTGSAKQSISSRKERMDCFVAGTPRNDKSSNAIFLMDYRLKPGNDGKSVNRRKP